MKDNHLDAPCTGSSETKPIFVTLTTALADVTLSGWITLIEKQDNKPTPYQQRTKAALQKHTLPRTAG